MNVVLIPAYEPDEALIGVVDELFTDGHKIVVVDDGSGENYAHIFGAIQGKVDIVTLAKNSGKGAALKAGMAYIKENLPECTSFITCDADGQHRPADVLRVKKLLDKGEKFVLTVRQRKGKIPLRSRFGNDLSKFVYALLTNRYLSDNQSGLRGFDISHIDWLLKVEKNNYDYEMNVLYYAAKMGIKISTLTIDAIYIENNASSHFNPVLDTVRIYRSLFGLAKGSFVSLLAAELIILVLGCIFGNGYSRHIIPFAGAISLLLCILLNRFVFLRQIPQQEYFTTIGFTIICYFVYTLMCTLLCQTVPSMPLIVIFNIVYLICLPLRFFMHQLLFLAFKTKE